MTIQEFSSIFNGAISGLSNIQVTLFEYTFTLGQAFKAMWFLSLILFLLVLFVTYGQSVGGAWSSYKIGRGSGPFYSYKHIPKKAKSFKDR